MCRVLITFSLFMCSIAQLSVAEMNSCKDIFFKSDQTVVVGYKHEKSLIESNLQKQQEYRTADARLGSAPYTFTELLNRTIPHFSLVDPLIREIESIRILKDYASVNLRPFPRFFRLESLLSRRRGKGHRLSHPRTTRADRFLSLKDRLNAAMGPPQRRYSEIDALMIDAETWDVSRFPRNSFSAVESKDLATSPSPRQFVISPHTDRTRAVPFVKITSVSEEIIYWPALRSRQLHKGEQVTAHKRFSGDLRPLYLASTDTDKPILVTRFFHSVHDQGQPLSWGPEIRVIDAINRSANQTLLAVGESNGSHVIAFPLFKTVDITNNDQLSLKEANQLALQIDRLIPETDLVNPSLRTKLWRFLRDSILIGRTGEDQSHVLFYNDGKSLPLWGKIQNLSDFTKAHDDILLKRKNYYHAYIIRHLSARDMTNYILELSKSSLTSDFFEILYILQTAQLAPPLYEKAFPRPDHLGYEARTAQAASIVPIGWQNEKSLQIHFRKHGANEMHLERPDEYLSAAMDFFKDADAPHQILAQRKSGSYFKYNFQTKEFGVLNANKEIVTYYIIDQQRHSIHDYLGDNLLNR